MSQLKQITIVGGSGFIGSQLIHRLRNSGTWRVRNIDLRPSPFFNELTEIGDARSEADMLRLLKGSDTVVLLAAQHRDDVKPVEEYYRTNVGGMKAVTAAMEQLGVKQMVFFSSVAVYGMNRGNPDETAAPAPFNHYGKSKLEAEHVLREWQAVHPDVSVTIVRPTVVFGERNRGNVYNLLHQISCGRFLMVGSGRNRKSMAYVGNVVAFVEHLLANSKAGIQTYNYTDSPDMSMNELVACVQDTLKRHTPSIRIPRWLGMMGGYAFDLLAFLTRRRLTISSVRIKKFCAETQFDSTRARQSGFRAPFTLAEGMSRTLEFEFIHPRTDTIEFQSE